MLIGDKYKIESDSLNATVYRRAKSKKAGGDSWRAEAYFATVKNALTYLVDTEVRETGLRDLKQVTEKQDALYALIKSLTLPGEPPEVAIKASTSDVAGVTSVQNNATGYNTAKADQNHVPADVTDHNKPDVTARIAELASQGLSSRKIADTMAGEGIEISHMTIARRLQGRLATKDNRMLHKGAESDGR